MGFYSDYLEFLGNKTEENVAFINSLSEPEGLVMIKSSYANSTYMLSQSFLDSTGWEVINHAPKGMVLNGIKLSSLIEQGYDKITGVVLDEDGTELSGITDISQWMEYRGDIWLFSTIITPSSIAGKGNYIVDTDDTKITDAIVYAKVYSSLLNENVYIPFYPCITWDNRSSSAGNPNLGKSNIGLSSSTLNNSSITATNSKNTKLTGVNPYKSSGDYTSPRTVGPYKKSYQDNYFSFFNMNLWADNDLTTVIYEASSEPTPGPEPTPGTPTQTEPGQSDNTVVNSGGTGDRNSDTITTPTNPTGAGGSFGTIYGLNFKQMAKVQGEIWNPNFLESITSLTNAPQSAIQGAYLVPFEVTDYTGILNDNNILLGNYEINIDTDTLGEVWKLYPSYAPKIPIVTDYVLQGRYGGFLDFEPYTKMTLYLPYIGFKTVSPHHIYSTDTQERKITIYYRYDVQTGQAKATLEVNGAKLYEWTATMGVSVSFSSSTLGAIKQQAALGTIGGAISLAGGITTHSTEKALEGAKSLGSTVTGALGKMNFSTVGGTGSSLERFDPQEAYLIIETTETAVPNDYNKNYGRPSLINSVLSDLEGFTTVPNPLFESSATDTEKQEIVTLLQQGVIIKKE